MFQKQEPALHFGRAYLPGIGRLDGNSGVRDFHTRAHPSVLEQAATKFNTHAKQMTIMTLALRPLRARALTPPVPGPTMASDRPMPLSAPCRACYRYPIVLLGALLSALAAAAQTVDQVVPQAKAAGYVTDLAGVLSQSGRDKLTALCTEVDQKAQAQIAVVTIKSLNGSPLEDYSIDLATRLGVGPKGSDRGVLILLVVDDHQYRFEVGYGLEGILPDGKVGGFGREAVPYLRANDYDGAVYLMTRRVADVIAADRGVTLTGSPPAPAENYEPFPLAIPIILFFLVLLFISFAIRGASRAGYRGRGAGIGNALWIAAMLAGSGRRGGGGWSGGFGGGGFGGGGGGFGGFGGGGFGGGGASGSW